MSHAVQFLRLGCLVRKHLVKDYANRGGRIFIEFIDGSSAYFDSGAGWKIHA